MSKVKEEPRYRYAYNLVAAFRRIGVEAFLEQATLDEVIEFWWAAQARKADKVEQERARRRKATDDA